MASVTCSRVIGFQRPLNLPSRIQKRTRGSAPSANASKRVVCALPRGALETKSLPQRNGGLAVASKVFESVAKDDVLDKGLNQELPLAHITAAFVLALMSSAPGAMATEEVGQLAVGLDTSVQLLYLSLILLFLFGATFFVVRQVLVRRELESTAKDLGEKVRSGSASSEEYFEMGVVMLRKKAYTQAITNLERSLKNWDGEPEEKAQAFNALGYAFYQQEKYAKAVEEYSKAVELQPGYVTAWNNLGDACEKNMDMEQALQAYEEALVYAPDNKIAKERGDALRARLQRLNRL